MAKKGYVGVGGVARKLKKGYIGVGGVARPCWSGGELSYYGTAATLTNSIAYHAGTSVGNYALFGGGYYHPSAATYSTVNAYSNALTRSTPTALSTARCHLAAASVGNYALFGGGRPDSSAVDAYSTSLTRSVPTALSQATGHRLVTMRCLAVDFIPIPATRTMWTLIMHRLREAFQALWARPGTISQRRRSGTTPCSPGVRHMTTVHTAAVIWTPIMPH